MTRLAIALQMIPRARGLWPRGLAWALVPLLIVTIATPAFAQQKKPVMENVFYNVVWGSAFGAILGAAISIAGSENKSSPSNFRESLFQGATLGGVIGYGVGVWMAFSGINFEPKGATLLSDLPDPAGEVVQTFTPDEPVAVSIAMPPPLFTLETSQSGPVRITGVKALVMNLRF